MNKKLKLSIIILLVIIVFGVIFFFFPVVIGYLNARFTETKFAVEQKINPEKIEMEVESEILNDIASSDKTVSYNLVSEEDVEFGKADILWDQELPEGITWDGTRIDMYLELDGKDLDQTGGSSYEVWIEPNYDEAVFIGLGELKWDDLKGVYYTTYGDDVDFEEFRLYVTNPVAEDEFNIVEEHIYRTEISRYRNL